jgi:small subunit ribosomal protein S9
MKKIQLKQTKSAPIGGTGRRKTAVARVWLRQGGSGIILVNGEDFSTYFDTEVTRSMVEAPLKVTKLDKNFDIQANVTGGGLVGQAGAICLGISRALVSIDEELKSTLKKYSFLTVDSRVKERKKYGQKAARRKFQFVKR